MLLHSEPTVFYWMLYFLSPLHCRYFCDYCDTYLTHDSVSLASYFMDPCGVLALFQMLVGTQYSVCVLPLIRVASHAVDVVNLLNTGRGLSNEDTSWLHGEVY